MLKPNTKDDTAAPRPTFMSSKQMADYLQDLRNNRIQRPNGSRPLPVKFASISGRSTKIVETPAISPLSHPTFEHARVDTEAGPLRCSSAQSHRRTHSAMSNMSIEEPTAGRPLVRPPQSREASTSTTSSGRVPSVSYKENGHRMVEKEEARALRRALEELDLQEEEGFYSVARDEAAELVWKHQNPETPYPNPIAPSRHPEYRHHRTQSVGRAEQDLQSTNSKLRKRGSYNSASGGSRSSSFGSCRSAGRSSQTREDAVEQVADMNKSLQPGEMSKIVPIISDVPESKHRRRSSGSKRNTSASLFRNPDDQIYEEPEEETSSSTPTSPPKPAKTLPLQVRRNPFSRVQFAKEGLVRSNTDPTFGIKRFDKYEIQKNPPSQSRNAEYTSNPTPGSRPTSKDSAKADPENDPELNIKDGKEVRGEDIRAATSMRLKDRSPKLPTPTIVTDSPGRPIVSFKQNWKPKEIEMKQEISLPPSAAPRPGGQPHFQPRPLSKAATLPVVPQIHVHEESKTVTRGSVPAIPQLSISPPPRAQPSCFKVPPTSINVPQAPSVPSISIDSPPRPNITISQAPSLGSNSATGAPFPTISVQEIPSITVNSNSNARTNTPSIFVSTDPISTSDKPSRPLPIPKISGIKPFSRTSVGPSVNAKPHWTPSSRRTTALCAQCALPIAGRIVSAAGSRFHPECFVCHHCGEGLECVAFYPEPEDRRTERVDRIRRRVAGEDVEIIEGMSEIDDGDESMRFYCHLDYHELFSPRCKSCKTPIEGEVIVACGAEWHVGHFFCAQCGDPFDSHTPFVEKDGYAWCVGCHTNRYSTKCKKCRKPVIDTVVKALGAEWHTQCFCCMECNGPFDDGRYFLRGDSQDPVCVRCEEKRLKA